MPLGKRKRRILLALGFFPVALMLLWVSLPLWFPLLLRPIANKYGVTYASYERAGYRHFIIHGLTFTNQAIVIRAERAEVLVPTVWLWRHAVKNEQLPFLKVNRWQFESRPAAKSGHGPASVYTNAQQFASVVGVLQRWLPTAFLSNGVIRVQKPVVELPTVTWAQATLAVAVTLPEANQRATVLATLGQAPYQLQVRSDSLQLQSTNQISLDATGLSIQSTNLWWSNQVNFQVQFDRASLLPEKATVQAENFQFPGEVARLKDFKE